MRQKFRNAIMICLMCFCLTGCQSVEGDMAEGDVAENSIPGLDGQVSMEENTEQNMVPSYSVEENRAAVQYLQETYGIKTGDICPKVILDCDMTYLGDDAMCMSILVQADSIGLIDLLGVTITGGNNFVSYGTNAALIQLEQMGRGDVSVYMGTDIPVEGIRDLEEQAEVVGEIDRWGAMYHFDEYVEPSCYHDLKDLYERKWGYSENVPMEQSAAEFMVEQAARYQGEVTIIVVGAATNVAIACQKDENFAMNTAGIIYMGTVIEEAGTFTPYADFNCFYDARAYDICLRSAFPKQMVVPHDAADTAVLTKTVYDMLDAKGSTLVSRFWVDNQYALYKRNPNYTMSCSDAIAAVVCLNPNVIADSCKLDLTVNYDVNSPEYGSVAISQDGNLNVVMAVDTENYWDFVTDLLCHVQ